MLPQKRCHGDLTLAEDEFDGSNFQNQELSQQFCHTEYDPHLSRHLSVPISSHSSQQNDPSQCFLPQNEDFIDDSFLSGETFSVDWPQHLAQLSDEKIPDRGDSTVCFGMICDVRVKIEGDISALSEIIQTVTNIESSYCPLDVSVNNGNFTLYFSNSDTISGVLNEQTSQALHSTAELETIEFRAYCTIENLIHSKEGRKKTSKTAFIFVNINVVGAQSQSSIVGQKLNSVQIFLQHPDVPEVDMGYENPHLVVFPGLIPRVEAFSMPRSEMSELPVSYSSLQSEKIEVHNEIGVVLNSLTRSRFLKLVEADSRIKTPLLLHQKEALDFIAQREFGPIPQAYSLWQDSISEASRERCFEHVITGAKRQFIPPETGGGILADAMGLGKTLTLLSTIILTSEKATEFWRHALVSKNGPQLLPARATLVIVPSESLINVWTQEIHKHVYGGLTVCIYHGRGRETNPEVLARADIVLTTYNTVSIEGRKANSALFRLHWFRIVLDEAHKIRTISTKLYKTASKLEAQIRWCMTGTPVQNSLEDIGALVSFLRVPLLDIPSEFKKNIIDPILKRSEIGSEGLRLLLDSICLRRANTLLDLPDIDDKYCLLNFTDSERAQYETANTEMSRAIKQQVSMENRTKGYFGIFQLEMRLRRLCNHGTYEEPFSEIQDDNLQIESSNAVNWKESTSYLCEDCGVDLSNELVVDDLFNGHFTICGHLLCSKCLPNFERRLSINKRRHCPICRRKLDGNYLFSEKQKVLNSSEKSESIFNSFRPTGYSTKVQSLLADVKKLSSHEKCIIFSGWTRSLDLIGHNFTEQNIKFRRIDGSNSNLERNKTLDEFRKVPSIQVLMMTTGTGAEGLNLAIANCVYILEPQWNPMVESQAIARVSRLGQKNKVKVIRYIIAGTVEATMRSQQTRKLALADVGWQKENSD